MGPPSRSLISWGSSPSLFGQGNRHREKRVVRKGVRGNKMLMPGAAVGDGEGYCLDPPQPGAQAAKWTGCWHPGPWSQVSPGALGALRCIGGKVRCTPCDLYASPTETIPPRPFSAPGPPSQATDPRISPALWGQSLPRTQADALGFPGVATSGRGRTLSGAWPHLTALPVPISPAF